jgi:hypothetical protein
MVRNPIDAFVLDALARHGLTLSPEADGLTLLRRVTLDLTGLPPTPAEADAFLGDPAPDAYERLVERLLASPRYGERWGRHWLDLAGYADSEGILDADTVRTAAWRYRDYVIRAFNADKPYDRFLQEQLAGDELSDYRAAHETQKELGPDVVECLVATGFLRCASDASRPDFVNLKDAAGYYYQTLDDTVKIATSATLGLTLECAKCHDHKYDPIPQAEYYRVQAVFASAYRPDQWVPQSQRRLLAATAAQEKEAHEHAEAALAPVRKRADELRQEFAGFLFTGRLGKLPEAIRDDVRVAVNTEPSQRTEVQKYLAAKFEKELKPDPKTLDRVLATEFVTYKARQKEIEDELKRVKTQPPFPEIRALYDLPGEAKTHLLRRGDYRSPGPEVEPGVLAALATPEPFAWAPPHADARTSGRRLAFARWLTQPGHPLTARVLVNRLWLHHFGEGIVATPDNFGTTGAPPTHPELLDWLADEFVRQGWSVKAMHRLILTSATYRQSAVRGPQSESQADPGNRLLGRQRLRRLEAEALRDAALSVAGVLNTEMFGEPVPVQRLPDGEVTAAAGAAGRRRSVYVQVRRSQPVTLLQLFDQPVMETNCTRRGASTVASQALALTNGPFLTEMAEAFAARVEREGSDDPAGYAVRIALGRPATAEERARLSAFLQEQASRYENTTPKSRPKESPEQRPGRRHALVDLCQMLLCANEFAHRD